MVLFLIDKGLDIEARDVEGCTPLHLAAREGNIDQVKVLVEKIEKQKRGSDDSDDCLINNFCVSSQFYLLFLQSVLRIDYNKLRGLFLSQF
jgi:ankyrin repeat protein